MYLLAKILIFAIFSLLQVRSQPNQPDEGACIIDIYVNPTQGFQPIFINLAGTDFVYPDNTGILTLLPKSMTGDDTLSGLQLWCSQPGFINFNTNPVKLFCKKDDTFYVGNDRSSTVMRLRDFGCVSWPRSSEKQLPGTCMNRIGVLIEVGFKVSDNLWLPLFKSCHRILHCHNFYVSYKIINAPNAPNVASSSWTKTSALSGEQLPRCDCNDKYTQATQRTTVQALLSNDPVQTAIFFPNPPGSFYLAKGHLAAKTDFIYAAQQRATFTVI